MLNQGSYELHEIYFELLAFGKRLQIGSSLITFKGSHLSISQSYALLTLARGGKTSIGVLAEDLGLSLSAVTKIIDTLERKKLVTRKPSLQDLRIIEVSLTKSGSEYVRFFQEKMLNLLEEYFSNSIEVDRKSIVRCLRVLNGILDSGKADSHMDHGKKTKDPETRNLVFRQKYRDFNFQPGSGHRSKG